MQAESSPNSNPVIGLLSTDNVLFVLARSGSLRLPETWLENHPVFINKILYPLLIVTFAILVPQLAGILGSPLLIAGFNLSDSQADLGFLLILVGGFLPFFFLIWLWLRVFERLPLWTTGMTRPALRPYLRGMVVGFLLFAGVIILLGAVGLLAIEEGGQNNSQWKTFIGITLVLCGWAVQGAAEELLARGFLLPVLGVRWGALAGVFISSIFFSVLHLENPNVSFFSLLNLFLFGLFAAVYALNEGNLWGVFAIHAVWNWAQGNLFGFEVSGLNLQSSMLFDFAEVGPDWITGGLFGPEGGTAVTLVLLLATLVVVFWSRRKAQLARNS